MVRPTARATAASGLIPVERRALCTGAPGHQSGQPQHGREPAHRASGRDAEWFFLTGTIYARKGWYDEAQRTYIKACELDPGNAEYHNALNNLNMTGGYGGYRPMQEMSACDYCVQLAICNCCCNTCLNGCCAEAAADMNTREIARGGLLAGFAVVLLYIGSGLIPQAAPALCISAGVVSAVPLIRSFALRTSLTVYAAVSALSLMLVPRKSVAAAYIAVCGLYPIVKYLIESRVRPRRTHGAQAGICESCARRAGCARIKAGVFPQMEMPGFFRARGVLVRGEHRICRF